MLRYPDLNQTRRVFLKRLLGYTSAVSWLLPHLPAWAQSNASIDGKNPAQKILDTAAQTVARRLQAMPGNGLVPDTRPGFGMEGVHASMAQLTQSARLPQVSTLIDMQKIANPAPDGRRVPVVVSTSLPYVKTMAILFDQNPNVMAAVYRLEEGALASIEIPIKMRDTGDVYVLVQSKDDWFYQKKNVRVLLGGCS